MSGWRKLPPVMGRAKPCACCGVMADYFAPESVIATGFGVAQLTRDGDRVYEYRDQESPMTGAEIEAKEAAARAEAAKAEAAARAAAEAGNRAEAERLAKAAADQKLKDDADAAAMREKAALEADEARVAAAALATQSAMTIAAPVAAAPAVKGVSVPGTWTCEVDDKLAALQHIAAHPEHLGLVEFSQSALNGLARAQKEGMQFPGLRAVFTRRISSR